jgi:hypothetical protein
MEDTIGIVRRPTSSRLTKPACAHPGLLAFIDRRRRRDLPRLLLALQAYIPLPRAVAYARTPG